MSDRLVEIPSKEWSKLRDLYKKDWPMHHVGYHTIENYLEWFKKEPRLKNIWIYSLNGDWSDGTFIVVDRYQVFFNTLNKSYSRLDTALSLLDYSREYHFNGYSFKHKPTIDKFLKVNNIKKKMETSTIWYFLSKEDAFKLQISVPKGFTLKLMNEEHAAIPDEVWPFRHEGSLFLLKRFIRLNPCIGVYSDDGELVAWCFRHQLGSLGTLQVKDSFRQLGFGSLVVKAMARVFAEMGFDTTASVVEDNIPSRNMFDKLGFKIIDKRYWLVTESPSNFLWKCEYDEET